MLRKSNQQCSSTSTVRFAYCFIVIQFHHKEVNSELGAELTLVFVSRSKVTKFFLSLDEGTNYFTHRVTVVLDVTTTHNVR
jgi:hypothetical protein